MEASHQTKGTPMETAVAIEECGKVRFRFLGEDIRCHRAAGHIGFCAEREPEPRACHLCGETAGPFRLISEGPRRGGVWEHGAVWECLGHSPRLGQDRRAVPR